MKNQRYSRGFTVIELMVTIAVAAILITIAVPSLQEIIKRNQVAAQNNELIALIHLARNEAIRRNPVGDNIVLVKFESTAATWDGAVFPPGGADDPPAGCPEDAIRCSVGRRVSLSAAEIDIRFDNRGYSVDQDGAPVPATFTLTHEKCESNRHAREIRVLPGGQVRFDLADC